ncbi:MAG: septal ring lytic transglycosylase RlpA family protein [Alphaproteobacteria bacterium]|nr:septal ring lytic transglycosylase RlpA family protein [Alphaproteobacteria bacterium]
MTKKIISLAVLTAVLSGCVGNGYDDGANGYGTDGLSEEVLVSTTEDQSLNDAYLLAAAPKYYVGSAYKVENVQYIPVEDLTYNKTGIAGIIPEELNGTKTNNGEIFDSNLMFATSKTLPLPTIVRVTNLDNGKSVVARVNNRGPFVNTRIMDLSAAAARKIGLNGQGNVQVQVLADQSIKAKNATLGVSGPQQTATVSSTALPEENISEPVSATPTCEPAATPVTTTVTTTDVSDTVAMTGQYAVQVAALYSESSANTLVARMRSYGNAVIVKEGDLYKVRIINLNAQKARSVIDSLRSNEGMMPGLLQDGRWVNADSI